MIWTQLKIIEYLEALNKETNKLADDIKTIKEKMRGRGVYPSEAGITIAQLDDIEGRLRKIGSNS